MDHAWIITDRHCEPLAICLDDEVADEFRHVNGAKLLRRPIVSGNSALEDLRKSRETPLKRKPPKREVEKCMELVKPANEAQSRILEK